SWFVFGDVDETGRYLFISTTRGTDKNELYYVDLGDPMHPNLHAPVRAVAIGNDANYFALGVVNGQIYIQTDKGTPRRKIVAAPLASPQLHWTNIIPEAETPIEDASLIAGRLAVRSLKDVVSEIRLYATDGKLEREVQLPGLGTASGLMGRFDRPEI